MPTAVSIIAKKVSPEGFSIAKEVLQREAVKRVKQGHDLVLQYGPVVFTVSTDTQEVHMYADNAGCRLLSATAKFMRDVWSLVPERHLVAPILNPQVKRLAERFGWQTVGELPWGHSLYFIRRPQ